MTKWSVSIHSDEKSPVPRGFNKDYEEELTSYSVGFASIRIWSTNISSIIFSSLFLLALSPGIIIHEASHIIGAITGYFVAKYLKKPSVKWVYWSAPAGNAVVGISSFVWFWVYEPTGLLAALWLWVYGTNMFCLTLSDHDITYWTHDEYVGHLDEQKTKFREVAGLENDNQ